MIPRMLLVPASCRMPTIICNDLFLNLYSHSKSCSYLSLQGKIPPNSTKPKSPKSIILLARESWRPANLVLSTRKFLGIRMMLLGMNLTGWTHLSHYLTNICPVFFPFSPNFKCRLRVLTLFKIRFDLVNFNSMSDSIWLLSRDGNGMFR